MKQLVIGIAGAWVAGLPIAAVGVRRGWTGVGYYGVLLGVGLVGGIAARALFRVL
jgi:hypothetical protein